MLYIYFKHPLSLLFVFWSCLGLLLSYGIYYFCSVFFFVICTSYVLRNFFFSWCHKDILLCFFQRALNYLVCFNTCLFKFTCGHILFYFSIWPNLWCHLCHISSFHLCAVFCCLFPIISVDIFVYPCGIKCLVSIVSK